MTWSYIPNIDRGQYLYIYIVIFINIYIYTNQIVSLCVVLAEYPKLTFFPGKHMKSVEITLQQPLSRDQTWKTPWIATPWSWDSPVQQNYHNI